MEKLNALVLAAGLGTRLMPLTEDWPKCLMPIQGVPILEHWLSALKLSACIKNVYVNTHHHFKEVEKFLSQINLRPWVFSIRERKLSGTAGILKINSELFLNKPLLIVHGDNWFDFKLDDFLQKREITKVTGCLITMMTFNCSNPQEVGIVELTDNGVVSNIFEKQSIVKGSRANAAIYIFEPEVVNWICKSENISDISTQVLPVFFNKIMSYHTNSFFRDIGTLKELIKAQLDPPHSLAWNHGSYWEGHTVFKKINDYVRAETKSHRL